MLDIEYIGTLIMSVLSVLLVLPLHELAHGFVAYKLGDPTARSLGRLTLNPIKHLDPIGALSLVFLRVGWAKPVPINPRYFKKPKRDMALVALAGPLSNILLAFLLAPIWLLLLNLYISTYVEASLLSKLLYTLLDFVGILHIINISLALFNLIPIPPLDGSRILSAFLPDKANMWIYRNERRIHLFLLIWLFGGNIIENLLLSFPIISRNPILSFIANFLSISDLLGDAATFLSDAMFSLWSLIPIFN